jgi:CBS-domain-containing membrane protein
MITDRDVCMSALFQGKTLSQMRVRDAMSKRLLSCQPGDRLGSAEKVMRIGQVRRLPVVDDQGALVGLLSLADLAREAEREGPKTGKVITETDVGDTLAEICAPAQPVAAAA